MGLLHPYQPILTYGLYPIEYSPVPAKIKPHPPSPRFPKLTMCKLHSQKCTTCGKIDEYVVHLCMWSPTCMFWGEFIVTREPGEHECLECGTRRVVIPEIIQGRINQRKEVKVKME